jgi:carboxymethylenebutenolidase
MTNKREIDRRIFDLYDEYCHGRIDRREFLSRSAAITLGSDLDAGVPFYGAAAASEDVGRIEAAMLIIYAGTDERINAMWPEYEAALERNGVEFEMEMYEGTLHGFHNNSTPRYNEVAAAQAWNRTIGFFRKHLG